MWTERALRQHLSDFHDVSGESRRRTQTAVLKLLRSLDPDDPERFGLEGVHHSLLHANALAGSPEHHHVAGTYVAPG